MLELNPKAARIYDETCLVYEIMSLDSDVGFARFSRSEGQFHCWLDRSGHSGGR